MSIISALKLQMDCMLRILTPSCKKGGNRGIWYSDESGLIAAQCCHTHLNKLTEYM